MAWTTPKTWAAGEVLTAANFNAHIRDNLNAVGPIVKLRKTADETVNNSAALQNDNHLFFSIAANEVWALDCFLIWTDSNVSAGALKVGWTFPSGCTGTWTLIAKRAGDIYLHGADPVALSATAQSDFGQTADQPALIRATVVNSTTAGTLQMQWAQASASVSDTIVRTNSTMIAHKIA
jgi:hypothetical protein